MNRLLLKKIVEEALLEDIGPGDLTTLSLIERGLEAKGRFYGKEKGVVAGLVVVAQVFSSLNQEIEFSPLFEDGDTIERGDTVALVEGEARDILQGERVALNFLQRMSGIATKTRYLSQLIKETRAVLVDTRKTTPGLRMLEKYAVLKGGGKNHRLGLYDAVLIKDNHIKVIGSIEEAILKARERIPITTKIEVEVESIEDLLEALEASPEIIMLDNMTLEEMEEGVRLNKGRALLEASGGITEENLLSVAMTGVDIISMGALTHSAKGLDISLDLSRIE